jgi:hypothetical protein
MTSPSSYRASPTRRSRRSKAEMEEIRSGLYDIVERGRPMTVRQVFYRAVSAGLIEKTETEYNQTVGRLLAEIRLATVRSTRDDYFISDFFMRFGLSWDGSNKAFQGKDGRLYVRGKWPNYMLAMPFSWIVDNTRWMRKPRAFDSVEDALKDTADFYRRALWANQEDYVEVWLEKEAQAGVLYPVTGQYDVPLMVTRGYPSISYVYSAAETITEVEKPTFIYYLGDHDPSGVDIPRNVEARLREFAPDADITFERLAVRPEQIEDLELPTRPTKKTDTRAKSFDGESVEVDAIDPDDLRDLVRGAIDWHIDSNMLTVTKAAEESEREILKRIAETAGAA